MPISETGKIKVCPQSGYTLIEMLAVLIVLSLIGLLVFPRFNRGEEKAYLKQIGNLIQTDMQTVSEEAVGERSEILVKLFKNGYRFEIGDIEIKRIYDKYQFHWNFSGEGEAYKGIEAAETFSDENDADLEGDFELSFNSNGSNTETTIQWETKHFTGSMLFKPDGSVNLNYAPRQI